MKFDVSILIPTYNQNLHYLEAAVVSAAMQVRDWKANVQIIVIDDGSEEFVGNFINGIAHRFKDHYFERYCEDKEEKVVQFLVLHHEENQGVAAALNTGIGAAEGDYIKWLSSDDLLYSDCCKRQVEFMREHDHAISYCAYDDGIPQTNITYPAVQYPSREMFQERLRENCFIYACSMVFHKSVFEEVGLFDPSYRHCQDYQMILRCAEQYDFYPLNIPLVRRRTHSEQMSHTLRDGKEYSIKSEEMKRLAERYGVIPKVYVPNG
jgi:glycosyltransferase involved in cell wall biosynthesis